MIGGDDGPAVGEAADAGASRVDHRLDREDHARLQLETGAGAAVMKYLRLFVELLADAVAAEFTHDRESVPLGVLLDRGADVAEVIVEPFQLQKERAEVLRAPWDFEV